MVDQNLDKDLKQHLGNFQENPSRENYGALLVSLGKHAGEPEGKVTSQATLNIAAKNLDGDAKKAITSIAARFNKESSIPLMVSSYNEPTHKPELIKSQTTEITSKSENRTQKQSSLIIKTEGNKMSTPTETKTITPTKEAKVDPRTPGQIAEDRRQAHNFHLRDDQSIANSKTWSFGKPADPNKVEFTYDAHFKLKEVNDKIKTQGVLSVNANDLEKAALGSYRETTKGKDTVSPDDFVNSRDALRRANPAQNPGDPAMSKAQDQAMVTRHTFTAKDGSKHIDLKEMAMEAKVGLQEKQLKELKSHHADPETIKKADAELHKSADQWHAKRQELGLEKSPAAIAVKNHDHEKNGTQKPNLDKQHTQAQGAKPQPTR